ncbi:hypothetical protein [Tardiphaga sp.]|uniref:COG3904 family protein n=1 Tax=Tardiphaga sp. TaxID=1926292 RepID=UPI0026224E87|nr:hypothetical protein [Tardiphaga sp.]MDB5616205.1 hypothetical protein [Tardiphaga sp.]
MFSRKVSLAAFVICAATNAVAAEVKSSALKDGRIVVSIFGEIAAGDTEAFNAAVKVANDSGKLVTSIRLNSIGGNLVEGVRLAEAVRFGKIITNVGQNATCASACFLVFAAGEAKYANYTARIGVHGASDKSGEETVQSGAATVSMARVAKELGVPPAIIGRMVVTPPSEMVWLSPTDLQSMGTTMVGKPAQLAASSATAGPASQLQPGAPMQLPSAAKAAAPPTWERMVDLAATRSAEQNNGKPQTLRACQPEFKSCYNAVIYKNSDGLDVALKVVRDMNDKIVRREACTFNKSGDIRRCLDWDTNSFHRDMQAPSGAWTKIADE